MRILLFLRSPLGALPSLSSPLFLLRGCGELENKEPHYDGRVAAMLAGTL